MIDPRGTAVTELRAPNTYDARVACRPEGRMATRTSTWAQMDGPSQGASNDCYIYHTSRSPDPRKTTQQTYRPASQFLKSQRRLATNRPCDLHDNLSHVERRGVVVRASNTMSTFTPVYSQDTLPSHPPQSSVGF